MKNNNAIYTLNYYLECPKGGVHFSTNFKTGVYFLRVTSNDINYTKKMTLIK